MCNPVIPQVPWHASLLGYFCSHLKRSAGLRSLPEPDIKDPDSPGPSRGAWRSLY